MSLEQLIHPVKPLNIVVGTLEAKGGVVFDGAVDVDGDALVTGTLTVGGKITADGAVEVDGKTTMLGTLDVTGTVTAINDFETKGVATLFTTNITGDTNIGAPCLVGGILTAAGGFECIQTPYFVNFTPIEVVTVANVGAGSLESVLLFGGVLTVTPGGSDITLTLPDGSDMDSTAKSRLQIVGDLPYGASTIFSVDNVSAAGNVIFAVGTGFTITTQGGAASVPPLTCKAYRAVNEGVNTWSLYGA